MSRSTDAPSPRPVVTRFAPSPTGFLHIGGARTALFNWLFARHHGGRFLLRIEDTDRARSTPEATEAIFDGLRWLRLDWDGEAVSQFSRVERHREVVEQMLAAGTAYRCYATPEEVAEARERARAEGRPVLFQSPWRDADPAEWPADRPYAVRLKAPREGRTEIEDAVQGRVGWDNATMDDLVLMRSDGTPTYMLAVVVDDHDMGVTHVIRGDDHLVNAGRQTLIYRALGWEPPVWAHIPLIHGPDGKKLSKRHGALGVGEYRAMGFLPEAMCNYLARLGWSHGDDEFFTREQAIAWFDLDGINKAPARFDLRKLEYLSGRHMAITPDEELMALIDEFLAATGRPPLEDWQRAGLSRALYCLKDRSKTLVELLDKAHFVLTRRPIEPDEKAAKALDPVSLGILNELTVHLQHASWSRDDLEAATKAFAEARGLKLGKVAPVLRAALAGRTVTPSVFDMMAVLGRDETLARLADAVSRAPATGGEDS